MRSKYIKIFTHVKILIELKRFQAGLTEEEVKALKDSIAKQVGNLK